MISGIMSTATVRRQRLEIVIKKRLAAFEYLKDFFHGDTFWMNCIYFSKLDIKKIVSTSNYKNKCLCLFYLAISLSKINDGLKLGDTKFIYAIPQLFEEWEYHFSSPHIQAMKYLMARNSPTLFPSTDFSTGEPDKVGIYKSQSEIVYEYLLTPHLPFELSFIEIFANLCDELAEFYEYLHSSEYSM